MRAKALLLTVEAVTGSGIPYSTRLTLYLLQNLYYTLYMLQKYPKYTLNMLQNHNNLPWIRDKSGMDQLALKSEVPHDRIFIFLEIILKIFPG